MRILSPILAGRDDEIAALRGWLAALAGGSGTTILIAGEAGIGKSRLLREAAALVAEHGYVALQGTCFELDRDVPFAPFVELLRRTSLQRLRESRFLAVAPQLLKLAPDLAVNFPALQVAPIAEPEQEKRDLFRAWMAWLAPHHPTTALQPALVIIEDLHWCDDISLELLLRLARSVGDRPIALLLSYRNDETTPSLRHLLAQLDRERLAYELALRPLPPEAVEAMIRAIFNQTSPISREFVEAMVALTEGNPFFVEEVLKSLVSAGDIFLANGRWDRKHLGELQVPRTVQDAVQRRMAALPAPARRVLALAATVGRRLHYEVLQALTGFAEADLLPLINLLIEAQLLVEENGDLLAFRHALTREAIYGALLKRERKALHRTIAETLERLYGAVPDQRAGELAHHFFCAGAWEQALAYAVAAGDRARTLYAPREALKHYTLALDAVHELGRSAPPGLLRARARMHDTLGEWDAARETYERALRVARETSDTYAEWQCLLDLGFLWTGRDYRRSREHLQRALDVARSLNDPLILAQSLNRFGNWEANAQQPERSRHLHLEALALYRAANDRVGQAQTHDLLGTEGYILSDVPFAAQHYAQAIALFRELDDRSGLASALAMSALQGASYALDTTTTVPTLPRDCRDAGEEAIRLAHAIGARPLEAYTRMIFALALGPRGEWGSALESAHESLMIASEIGHEANIASARWALGAIYHDMLDFAQAQSQLEQALALISGRGAAFILGHISACLARVHIARSSGHSQARVELDTAERVLNSMQDAATPMQTVWQRALWAARAELLLARAQPEAALHIVERLMRDAGMVPRLWYLRGMAFHKLGRSPEAEMVLREACGSCEAHGMLALLWRVRLALGQVQHVQRRARAAQEQYEAARGVVERLAGGLAGDVARQFTTRALALIPRTPQPTSSQIARDAPGGLTAREREVAALIAEGRTNREIAAQLVVSERTVEKHVENVMHKLGFATRAHVAVWAASQNLRS